VLSGEGGDLAGVLEGDLAVVLGGSVLSGGGRRGGQRPRGRQGQTSRRAAA
jgi:hypothetical protein